MTHISETGAALLVMVLIIGGIPTMYYLLFFHLNLKRRFDRYGYTETPVKATSGFLGWRETKLEKSLCAGAGGMILSKNPVANRHYNILDNAVISGHCDKCQTKILTLERGSYTRENWEVYYLFGVPLRLKFNGVEEQLCPTHNPIKS